MQWNIRQLKEMEAHFVCGREAPLVIGENIYNSIVNLIESYVSLCDNFYTE